DKPGAIHSVWLRQWNACGSLAKLEAATIAVADVRLARRAQAVTSADNWRAPPVDVYQYQWRSLPISPKLRLTAPSPTWGEIQFNVAVVRVIVKADWWLSSPNALRLASASKRKD